MNTIYGYSVYVRNFPYHLGNSGFPLAALFMAIVIVVLVFVYNDQVKAAKALQGRAIFISYVSYRH